MFMVSHSLPMQIDLQTESIIRFIAPSSYPVITFGPFSSPTTVLVSLSHAVGKLLNNFSSPTTVHFSLFYFIFINGLWFKLLAELRSTHIFCTTYLRITKCIFLEKCNENPRFFFKLENENPSYQHEIKPCSTFEESVSRGVLQIC